MYLIAAISRNNAIGRNKTLPWRSKEDLKIFKSMTYDHVVVMGRKTAEGLGKPLVGRTNVVLTHNPAVVGDGFIIATNVSDVISLAGRLKKTIFVIGGAEIYRQMMIYADAIFLTSLEVDVPDADAFFPVEDMFALGFSAVSTLVDFPGSETSPPFKQFVYRREE